MIAKQILDAIQPLLELDGDTVVIPDRAVNEAQKLILAFAAKDIDDLHDHVTFLAGLRVKEALMDPDASAAHINAAMKWLGQAKPQTAEDKTPQQIAMENAIAAMQKGGKLPPPEELE